MISFILSIDHRNTVDVELRVLTASLLRSDCQIEEIVKLASSYSKVAETLRSSFAGTLGDVAIEAGFEDLKTAWRCCSRFMSSNR